MISKILVPTDGSKTAQKTGTYAVGLAKQLNASIIVISVVDKQLMVSRTVSVGRALPDVAESIDDYLREAAERYAGKIKKLCEKKGVQSKAVIKPGHPVEEIVKEAEKTKVDLNYYGFPWTKRFSSCAPWECYLWCDTQRYDNPNSGGKEEMMCVQC